MRPRSFDLETQTHREAACELTQTRTCLQTFPNKEYIVYEGERLSYADANERILRLASLFYENGVRKGDRVAIAMRNLPEWIIS